jgi:hypothetical protein
MYFLEQKTADSPSSIRLSMQGPRLVVLFACFAAFVLAGSADYHAIEGAYTPTAHSRQCVVIPSAHPRSTDNACSEVLGPDVDVVHYNNYVTNSNLPEEALLELADLIGTEQVRPCFAGPADPKDNHIDNWLQWFPRSNNTASKQTVYVHKTRCDSGIEGEHVHTDKNVYKKCSKILGLVVNQTYHLPPNVCIQTCDEDASCTGYMTDQAGSCSILTAKNWIPGVENYYFLVGSSTSNASTHKTRPVQPISSSSTLSDYFPIEGAYFSPGIHGQCTNTADIKDKVGSHSCSYTNPTSEVDRKAQIYYPSPVLPESLLLALANANKAENAFQQINQEDNFLFQNAVSWLPRTNSTTSKQTTYIHKTRCSEGVAGEQVTAGSSIYKKCLNTGRDLALNNTFHLPPSVCQQTCDQQSFCIGYTIDQTGAGCWILQEANTASQGFVSYWLIGSS